MAVLPCNATGTPVPTIRWIKDGAYLPKRFIHSDGVLEIQTALRSDASVYTCEASNRAGRATKNTTLDVLCNNSLFI